MGWFGSDRGVPDTVPAPDRPRALALYQYATCPYCHRVLRRLPDLGLVDAVKLRDVRADPTAMAELRAATGGSQVPCLFVDGEPLLESADILRWLEAYAARG